MTLRRLAAPAGDLTAAGISVTAIFEDPLEVAARSARGAGFRGTVLSEPEPYELSRSLQLQSVPTTLLFDPEGSLLRRVVGWDREGLDDLLGQASALAGAPAVRVTGEHPVRKPGCAAKSTYDAETLAALNAAGPHDELEDMFERGWSDGLPVIPPTRERVDAMLGGRDPSLSLGRGASGDGRGDARAGRVVCGARRLPARVLPGRRRCRAGGARAGLQSQRPGRHHAAGGTAGDPQRPGATFARPQQLDRSARSGTARKPDDRTRAAAADQPHRRRLPRQARPRDARPCGQDRLLHGRERGGQPVGAAIGPARLRVRAHRS